MLKRLPPKSEAWPPDYVAALASRQQRLRKLKGRPELLLGAKELYRERPVDFINHWGVTFDPRVAGGDLPTKLPFILFERQRELVAFLQACVRAEANGLVEKSRDMGATWVCAAFSVWLWLFWDGSSIGWGSRERDLVDKIGDPDSIFEKMRITIRELPRLFWPKGFSPSEHLTFMRLVNPENGSTITGDIGDNIGRGGRKLIYFKDESAHYLHPELVEAALSDNTNIQIDISSVHGLGNVFHRKREAGVDWAPGQPAIKNKINVLVMDWSDHPLKTQAWHDGRKREAEELGLQHVFAQEVERNYAAAVIGVIVKAEWFKAAVDAHIKLGFEPTGAWGAALDVADEGDDTNALALRRGPLLTSVEEWGERDTGVTTRRAVAGCAGRGTIALQYDCVGIGAGVKAEANRLRDDGSMPRGVALVPWNAGAAVIDPKRNVVDGDRDSPLNEDFYQNLKAQGWWQLARRFERTWRAVNEPDYTWAPDDLISISSEMPLLRKLEKEICQPTMDYGVRLKMVVDKKPSGTKSPNLADAVMMAFWPIKQRTFDFRTIGAASVPDAEPLPQISPGEESRRALKGFSFHRR